MSLQLLSSEWDGHCFHCYLYSMGWDRMKQQEDLIWSEKFTTPIEIKKYYWKKSSGRKDKCLSLWESTFIDFKGLPELQLIQLAWLEVASIEEITVKLYYKNKLLSWILSNRNIINMTAYMILIYWYWYACKLQH